MDELKLRIEQFLNQKIVTFELKGKGDCNYAYYVETADGKKYIVKREREVKETEDQNSLVVEGNVIKKLAEDAPTLALPRVVFVCENPLMYGYEYIEGDLMRNAWSSLLENERIDICRSLGYFHAEIGTKFTKEMAQAVGIRINESLGWHPQIMKDYDRLIIDSTVPDEYKDLVKKARSIYDATLDKVVFQFIHNDAHPENIIIKDKKIAGIIDFGDTEYGEIAKEFSRYVRDYPNYFQYIISAYEEKSGNKLSYAHLVSNALISGFVDIVNNYVKGGDERKRAENAIKTYKRLLDVVCD